MQVADTNTGRRRRATCGCPEPRLLDERAGIPELDRGLPRVDHQEPAFAVRRRVEGFFPASGEQSQDADTQQDRTLQVMPDLHRRFGESADSSRARVEALSFPRT